MTSLLQALDDAGVHGESAREVARLERAYEQGVVGYDRLQRGVYGQGDLEEW